MDDQLPNRPIRWCNYHDAQIVNVRDQTCWDAERLYPCEPISLLLVDREAIDYEAAHLVHRSQNTQEPYLDPPSWYTHAIVDAALGVTDE